MSAVDGASSGQAMRPDVNGAPEGWVRVCASEALAEGGDGVRFELPASRPGSPALQAFAVRYDGRVHAWLNRCAHVPVELDWMPGKFFDDSGLMLICATHGATYEPDTGRCVGGPCRGKALEPVTVRERNGIIWADPGPQGQGS
jgi:nitrite reductase/ring-hydroxylating ferredoxin subunit